MGILEKSERIGHELKNTAEGKRALELYNRISQYSQETTYEFFELINKHYLQTHFFSVQQAVDIFRENVDHELIGEVIKKVLCIDEIHDFAAANIPIGDFVDKLGKEAFGNEVKYELPKSVSFTPELVRLTNSLTVECLRTNILQSFLREYHTKAEFATAIKRFDELRGGKPVVPYSKEDRSALFALKEEFGESCKVELLYEIVAVMAYIKSMIFDAFYDNIFEIYEETDVLFQKQRKLRKCIYSKFTLRPGFKVLGSLTGWILKIHNANGGIKYYQITRKTMHCTKNECNVAVYAIELNLL